MTNLHPAAVAGDNIQPIGLRGDFPGRKARHWRNSQALPDVSTSAVCPLMQSAELIEKRTPLLAGTS